MPRIYKRTDKIRVQIDDIVAVISPLTLDQKTEVQSKMALGTVKKDLQMVTEGVVLAVRYGLRAVEGIQDANGKPYKLEIQDDMVTRECVSDLFNLEMHKKLVMICSGLVSKVPTEFTDEEGQPIEGIKILSSEKEADGPNS